MNLGERDILGIEIFAKVAEKKESFEFERILEESTRES